MRLSELISSCLIGLNAHKILSEPNSNASSLRRDVFPACSAVFYVSGAPPGCRDNISEEKRSMEEFDSVELNCSVESYKGNWRPVFQCQPETMYSETREASNGAVVYRHKINVTRDMNNKSFTCSMLLTKRFNVNNETIDIDYAKDIWTSQPIVVKCKFNLCI